MKRVAGLFHMETDSLELTDRVEVFVMDITESEKNTVETLRKLNGDTYELTGTTGAHGGLRYEPNGADDPAEYSIMDGNNMTLVTEDNNGNSLTYTISYDYDPGE